MPTEVAYRYEVVDGYPWSLADMCAPRPIFPSSFVSLCSSMLYAFVLCKSVCSCVMCFANCAS